MSKRAKKKPDPDELFGELRAIVQQPPISKGQRLNLWNLCVRMYRYHPEHYTRQWVPYLEAYASVWKPEAIVVGTLEELIQARQLAPFARFTFSNLLATETLSNKNSQTGKVLKSPHVEAIIAIRLNRFLWLPRWLDASELSPLKRIHVVQADDLRPYSALVKIAESTSRETLEELVLEGTDTGRFTIDDAYRQVRELDVFPLLRAMTLTHTAQGAEPLRCVLASRVLASLHTLVLSHVDLSDEDLAALVLAHSAAPLPLRSLDLSGLTITSSPSPHLIAMFQVMPDLTHLSLCRLTSNFKPVALCTALADMHGSVLESLDFSGSDVGIQALRKLAASTHLKKLRSFGFRDIVLSEAQAKLFASHPFFTCLDELGIEPSQLDTHTASILAASTTLRPHLTRRFASWHPGLCTWPNL